MVRRRVTRSDIDAAILRWLTALERVPCRSVSAQLVTAARLGTRVTGGKPPEMPMTQLVEAERPLRLLTRQEKHLLICKYWQRPKWTTIERVVDGRNVEYLTREWRGDEAVAKAVGAPSVRAVKARLARARAKIRWCLEKSLA